MLRVEERINRLEPEVGHANEIGVRKHQRHAQLTAVRLANESDFFRQELSSALALWPVLHKMRRERGDEQKCARELLLRRRRARAPWVRFARIS